jgi:hypothetical protein
MPRTEMFCLNGIYHYPYFCPLLAIYYIMQKIIDARDNAINVMTPCPPQNSVRRFVADEDEDDEADATVFEADDFEVVELPEELADAVDEMEEKEVEVELPETMRMELPDAEAVVESVLSVTRLDGRVVLPLAVVLAPLVVAAEALAPPVMAK